MAKLFWIQVVLEQLLLTKAVLDPDFQNNLKLNPEQRATGMAAAGGSAVVIVIVIVIIIIVFFVVVIVVVVRRRSCLLCFALRFGFVLILLCEFV